MRFSKLILAVAFALPALCVGQQIGSGSTVLPVKVVNASKKYDIPKVLPGYKLVEKTYRFRIKVPVITFEIVTNTNGRNPKLEYKRVIKWREEFLTKTQIVPVKIAEESELIE